MRILLTGSTGFIGQSIVWSLLSAGHTVIAPVRLCSIKDISFSHANLVTIPGNFYDNDVIESYAGLNPQILIHLAALRGEGHGTREDYRYVNEYGTEQLANFALSRSVMRFIYFSTVGIYGTIPASLPADLNTKINPDTNYHLSKYHGEKLVESKLNNKIPFTIIRPTITYGPGDNGFVYKLVELVRKKRFPLIQKKIWIHLAGVENHSNLVQEIINTGKFQNSIIIAADREPVRLDILVDEIYAYFYNRKYPAYLKVPSFLYSAGENISNILALKSLNTSFKLLSYSWYYDTQDLIQHFSYPLIDTLAGIRSYLYKQYAK
jgi:nucleoside-diphosphate-sugar epimerase